MAWTPACAAAGGVSKSGSPTPRSRTSSPAALRRLASLLMATVSEALRCWTLGESGSGMRDPKSGSRRGSRGKGQASEGRCQRGMEGRKGERRRGGGYEDGNGLVIHLLGRTLSFSSVVLPSVLAASLLLRCRYPSFPPFRPTAVPPFTVAARRARS